MIAYLSRPDDSVGPYPAIIVIHGVWGLNEQIKGVTRRYANEGFVAIAPNLFTRHSDLLTEKNIAKTMIPMFSMPRDKRNDPTAIQELMEYVRNRQKGDEFFLLWKGSLRKSYG
ncbi:MAG: dienelactone hydrolase family protein [Candidatus Nitrosopolaris sp.]